MTLTEAQKKNIFVGVVAVVAFMWLYATKMIKPQNVKIQQLTNELEQTKKERMNMERRSKNLPKLQKEYDELLVELGKTEKRLPKEKKLEEILRLVTDYSDETGIEINSFSPGKEDQQTYFIEFPVRLTFQAQFHTIGKFLSILGQEERIIKAEGLQLTPASDAIKGHTIKGSFNLKTYTYKG